MEPIRSRTESSLDWVNFPCAYRSSATVEVPGGRDEQQRHSKDMAQGSIVDHSSPRMISDYRFRQPYSALATSMEEGQSAGEHTISSGASCGPQDSTEFSIATKMVPLQ